MSRLTSRDKDKDGGKAKFKRPFPYPLPQFSNFSMDFPSNDDGVLSYQRRYQLTQQQRINRFRQQRNFRSLRDPPLNYSGTSTYERETDDEEQQALMRPRTPTPTMGTKNRRGWSPDIERHSSSSWRGSSVAMSRELPYPLPVQTFQPLIRESSNNSSNNSSSRSRVEDVVMVENNSVSAPRVEENASPHPPYPTD